MARDANRAMNDLPTPGQPDFDMSTMKLASPTPQPKVSPTPLPPDMTQLVPAPYAEPYHSMNIPPPPDPVEAKISKLMAPAPTPPPLDAGTAIDPQAYPPPVNPRGSSGGSSVDRMHQQQVDRIQAQIDAGHLNPDVGKKQIEAITALPTAGSGQQDDWGKWATGGGAAAIVALLMKALLSKGRGGGNVQELEKALQLGAPEVKPALEDFRPRTYGDDTIAPATDEARMRVNDASGGQEVTQAGQDKLARQADINSGKIKPQDYMKGEKPKPGTEGYKQWFKFRQQSSKKGAGDTGVRAAAE